VPLLNAYVPRTNHASTRVKVVPTCDKPLEQCAVKNRLEAGGGVPLLNAYVPRTNHASTRVKVVPTCDKPLEQCVFAMPRCSTKLAAHSHAIDATYGVLVVPHFERLA
jgi:hypothetical protein